MIWVMMIPRRNKLLLCKFAAHECNDTCSISHHPRSAQLMLMNSEAAIWSNIAACAITANTDKKLEKDQLPIVNQIGLKAVRICLAMKDLATVGIIKKCCTFSFSCSI
jgi:hypothetical protein